MSTPAQTPPQGPPPSGLDSLVEALGNAAERSAEKGAGAQDPDAAKGFGAAALSYVQALMALVAPKVASPTPEGPSPEKQQMQEHMANTSQALSDLARREPAQVHVHPPQRGKGLRVERDDSGNAVAYRMEE